MGRSCITSSSQMGTGSLSMTSKKTEMVVGLVKYQIELALGEFHQGVRDEELQWLGVCQGETLGHQR
jgi:hypothetical protein